MSYEDQNVKIAEGVKALMNATTLSDARLFVAKWAELNQIQYHSNLGLTEDGKRSKYSQIESDLILDYSRAVVTFQLNQRKVKIIVQKDDLLKKAFTKYLQKLRTERISELKDKIRFWPAKDMNQLRIFIHALTGSTNDVDLNVMAHFVWQSKRKLYGLSVDDHLMPILVGSQRSGKSTAVKKLTDILDGFVSYLSVPQITDDRYMWALEENYIAVCDEMSGMVKADIEKFKYIVTANVMTGRPLYSNSVDKIPNNSTFIGTSNKPLNEIIKDETGLGRFYPITTKSEINWELINQINYLEIWQSIDESKEKGYLQLIKDQIRSVQEDNRNRHSVELFCEQFELVDSSMNKPILKSDLYDIYKQFCISNGHYQIDSNNFAKKLKSLGIEGKRINRKTDSIYLINANSLVQTIFEKYADQHTDKKL